MWIFVRHSTGRTFSIDVEATTTVLELKKRLEQETQLPVAEQELTFCEKPLRDEDTMLDCDVGSEAIVKLWVKPPASSSSSSSSSSSTISTADQLLEEFDFPLDDEEGMKKPARKDKEPEDHTEAGEEQEENPVSSLAGFFDFSSSSRSKKKKKKEVFPKKEVFLVCNTKEQSWQDAVIQFLIKVLSTSIRKAYLRQLRFFTSVLSFFKNSLFLPIFRGIRWFLITIRYSRLVVGLLLLFSKVFSLISNSSSFLWTKTANASSFLWSHFSRTSSFLFNKASKVSSFFWTRLSKLCSFLWTKVSNTVNAVSNAISKTCSFFLKTFSFFWRNVCKVYSFISTKIYNTLSSLWKAISKACSFTSTKVSNSIKYVWKSISKACSFVATTIQKVTNALIINPAKFVRNLAVKSFNKMVSGVQTYAITPLKKTFGFVFVRVPQATINFCSTSFRSSIDFTKRNIIRPTWKAYGILSRAVERACSSAGRGVVNRLIKPTVKFITKLGARADNLVIKSGKGVRWLLLKTGNVLDRFLVQPFYNLLTGTWNRILAPIGRSIKTTVRSIPSAIKFTGRSINRLVLSPVFDFMSWINRTTTNAIISSALFADKHVFIPVSNAVTASSRFLWRKTVTVANMYRATKSGLRAIINTVKTVVLRFSRGLGTMVSRIRCSFVRLGVWMRNQLLSALRGVALQLRNRIIWPLGKLKNAVNNRACYLHRSVRNFFKYSVVLPIKRLVTPLCTTVKTFINSLCSSLKKAIGSIARFLYHRAVLPAARALKKFVSFIWKYTAQALFKLIVRVVKFIGRNTIIRASDYVRLKLEEITLRVKGEVSAGGFSLGIEPGIFVKSEEVPGAAMVQLENRQFYSIRVRNNESSTMAECIVNIDGKKIGIFRMHLPTLVIEAHPNQHKRFVFVKEENVTPNLKGASKGESGTGLVQVICVPPLAPGFRQRPSAEALKKAKEDILGLSGLEEYNSLVQDFKETAASGVTEWQCNTCKGWFPSRNKLFQHIKTLGHAAEQQKQGGERKSELVREEAPGASASSTKQKMTSGRTVFSGTPTQRVSTTHSSPLDWTKAVKLSLCLVAAPQD